MGFSAFVSIGDMVDVDFGDLIDYFGIDEDTRSIVLYIESITGTVTSTTIEKSQLSQSSQRIIKERSLEL